MMRALIGLALLSGSWLMGLGYYHPANWSAWVVLVVLGTVLLASTPTRLPDRRETGIALAMLLPAVWLVPWPYRAALLAIVSKGAELAGRAYNLGSREIVSLGHFVQRSAEILGVDLQIVAIPREVIARAGIDPDGVSPYSPWANHLHSIARAQHELDFQPTPMDDWLAPTIEWHLEHRRYAEPPGWELREAEAKLAGRWKTLLTQLG